MTIIEHSVLPWFREPATEQLPVGTRLFTFADYHDAPIGTVARMGRKNGAGQVRTKTAGGAWEADASTAEGRNVPVLTSYGIENLPSYVEATVNS